MSYSCPNVIRCSPVTTSQTTTRPDLAPWPPLARTRGQARDRPHPRGMNYRFDGQVVRHGRRPFWLGKVSGFEFKVHAGPGGGDRFAPGRFQQAIRDPFLEHLQLLVTELRPIRRHERLFRVRERFPELAAVRTSGSDHRARTAAFEHSLVAGEVQVGFFLVRVVALRAVGLDERQDLVGVIDLVLGHGRETRKRNG